MTIELFSAADPAGASIVIPGGVANPGWLYKPGTTGLFKFTNRDSPFGLSPVKGVTFKQTKGLKITAKEAGLALLASQGAVGVRITYGSIGSARVSPVREHQGGPGGAVRGQSTGSRPPIARRASLRAPVTAAPRRRFVAPGEFFSKTLSIRAWQRESMTHRSGIAPACRERNRS
jgi:hypothetical protein